MSGHCSHNFIYGNIGPSPHLSPPKRTRYKTTCGCCSVDISFSPSPATMEADAALAPPAAQPSGQNPSPARSKGRSGRGRGRGHEEGRNGNRSGGSSAPRGGGGGGGEGGGVSGRGRARGRGRGGGRGAAAGGRDGGRDGVRSGRGRTDATGRTNASQEDPTPSKKTNHSSNPKTKEDDPTKKNTTTGASKAKKSRDASKSDNTKHPRPVGEKEGPTKNAREQGSQPEPSDKKPKSKQQNQAKQKLPAKANVAKAPKDQLPQVASDSTTLPPNQSQQTSDLNYGKGTTITVLHVAEKPSIAQAIVKGLAPPSANVTWRSAILPVHEFAVHSSHAFPKAPYAQQCVHRITSVA